MNRGCECGESSFVGDSRKSGEGEITLAQLPVGKSATVVRVNPDLRGRKKFADVGILAGARLTMEAHSFLGGLYRVRILDTSMAIQADMAQGITMKDVCDADVPVDEEDKYRNTLRIALAGNPNCGKTSIFNALTGTRQHVGNYPGVTVESKSGSFVMNGIRVELIDLPGVYSLSSSSPEEEVVFQELMKPGIDLILNVIDSTIPQRSLYLTTQLAELHIPMFLAFNMSDDADTKGLKFDLPKLERYFGAPIVQTVGSHAAGVKKLLDKLSEYIKHLDLHEMPMLTYGDDIDDAINDISAKIDALHVEKYQHIPSRFFAIKLLEHDQCVKNLHEFWSVHDEVEAQIRHLDQKHAIDADTFMADRRYAMLAGACRGAISVSMERARREYSDKIDKVLTNKILGLPVFLLIIYLTFWFTFTFAQPFMNWIELFFGWVKTVVESCWAENTLPYLRSLVTEGIINGVGGVLVFLPNILFLFFAIAILEDSGYMSRAAFVMDGIMRQFGLQGRSFVPLVLGFGCNVPAILATRTIESDRDRAVTIMVLPMMSCGARLPIYSLIIPAFFAVKYQASIMCLIYVIGVAFSLMAARLLKGTLFKGDGEVYLMELPPYRCPILKSLMLHMWDRSKMYIHKAGTIILLTSIILYICNTYPKTTTFSQDYETQIEQLGPEATADEVAAIQNMKRAEEMENTISGRVGKILEPAFRPLGFDWQLITANIAALSAKEVFVAQLGILYGQGASSEGTASLQEQLQKKYTPLQAFCIMIFALLSIPCLATLAVIRKELNSWKLATADAIGLFCLAYLVTLIVFQVGTFLQIGTKLI